MPFYRMDFKDGSSSMVHMRIAGKAPKQCKFPDFDDPARACLRMADALCDAVVEAKAGETFTCDKPMCDRHRTHAGKNRDFCPDHQHLAPTLPLLTTAAQT